MKLYLSPMRDFQDLSGLDLLWPQRRNEVLKYFNADDRARSLAAGLMLFQVLGIRDSPQISFNRYGKPFLLNSNVHFNLSHSGDYIVLAIDENEIGVDIEKILPYSDEIAQKCFVFEEYQWLKQQADDKSFYALWTAKESVMKACGLGLHMAPESFSVFPVSAGPHLIHGRIWFLSWHLHDGHQICVASEKAISQTDIVYLSKSDLLTLPEETEMNVLNLKATPENLDRLIEFVDNSLSPHNFPPQTVSKAKIACEEIFINICSYAYVPDTGTVQICSRPAPDSVSIEFEDRGRPFNPLSEDRLKNKVSGGEFTEGGHGILMAQNLVSEMSYRFSDGKNILTMVIKKEE